MSLSMMVLYVFVLLIVTCLFLCFSIVRVLIFGIADFWLCTKIVSYSRLVFMLHTSGNVKMVRCHPPERVAKHTCPYGINTNIPKRLNTSC